MPEIALRTSLIVGFPGENGAAVQTIAGVCEKKHGSITWGVFTLLKRKRGQQPPKCRTRVPAHMKEIAEKGDNGGTGADFF